MDKAQLLVVIKEGQDDKLYDTDNIHFYLSKNKKNKKLSNVDITFIIISCILAIVLVVVASIIIRKKYFQSVEHKKSESTLENIRLSSNAFKIYNN